MAGRSKREWVYDVGTSFLNVKNIAHCIAEICIIKEAVRFVIPKGQ